MFLLRSRDSASLLIDVVSAFSRRRLKDRTKARAIPAPTLCVKARVNTQD
jgi:hypothetical protein